MVTYLHNFFMHHYTLCTVMLGTSLLGITAGTIGVFAVLRKQSLLGDMISHAAFPGVALAFLITRDKSFIPLMIGGILSGTGATMATLAITRITTLKLDTVLGIMLSVFFGTGLVIMTIIQKLGIAQQGILNAFIFGNASTLLPSDIIYLLICAVVVFGCVIIFWKEFMLITFDPHYAHTVGLRIWIIDILLTFLLLITIIIGLQTVGVILMSALIIAPAAAARQWTNRLAPLIFMASLIGASAGICGTLISNAYSHVPTGPVIVIFLSIIALVSLIIAPRRLA